MEKISCKINDKQISFGINKIKYLIGYDYVSINNTIQEVRRAFAYDDLSEYAVESNTKPMVRINDESIDFKKVKLFEVNEHFNLVQEIKLGSKSIVTSYLETILADIENEPTVQTINILLDDLTNMLSEKICSFDNFEIYPKIIEFNAKSILKLLEPVIIKDEVMAHPLDLTYDEIIVIQVKLLEKIAESNYSKKYFVVVNIPYVSKRISDCLEEMNLSNLSFIICSDHYHEVPKREDVMYYGNIIVDFMNEVEIYNLFMNYSEKITLEEMKEEINLILDEFITGKVKKSTVFL